MSHQPVYRRPRSHAYSCRCKHCVQARPDNTAAACFWGVILFSAVVFWPEWVLHGKAVVIAGIAWWGSLAAIGMLILVTYLRGGGKAKGYHAGPVTPGRLPPPPPSVVAPPACQHFRAERIESVLDKNLIYHCWCPDCDPECRTPLPANFRRPCCGTEPGTPHWWTCPQAMK